jgi:lipopolysaccharide transport system permease protein
MQPEAMPVDRMAAASAAPARPVTESGLEVAVSDRITVLEPGRAERNYWQDIWRYRELFAILAWRDVAVRYKQTVVGVVWALIRPLLTMVVFTAVFGHVAKLPSDGGIPYPVLVFAGLLPWFLFSSVLSEASNSMVGNANLISKVYFPRLVIPASSAMTSMVDFFVSAGFLVLLMVWYQFPPAPGVVLLPVFVVLAFGAALGGGVWVAALMVEYRDFKHIIPFVVQFGLYASPVAYATASLVPERWRLLYSLNPMVGVIDGFRWAILGGEHTLYWPGLALSTAVIVLLVASGIWYFRRTERSFADVI